MEKGNRYPQMDEQIGGSPAYLAHVEGHPFGGAECCGWCEGAGSRKEVDPADGGEGSPEGGSPTMVTQIEGDVNSEVDLDEWFMIEGPSITQQRKDDEASFVELIRPKGVQVILPSWLMNEKGLATPRLEGEIVKETSKAILFRGTVYLAYAENCHRCGQTITNPVSKYVGYGPICSEYLGIPRDIKKEDLERFKEEARRKGEWEGWLPKSRVEILREEKF